MTTKELRYGNKIAGKIYFIKQLDILGVGKRYTGYFELIEIMNILINENNGKIASFSRQVYPVVAERFNVPDYTIERNIRNLIHKCWNEELCEKLNCTYVFGGKPKCQHFIFMVKNYLEKLIS